jgi:hypothetical protein
MVVTVTVDAAISSILTNTAMEDQDRSIHTVRGSMLRCCRVSRPSLRSDQGMLNYSETQTSYTDDPIE